MKEVTFAETPKMSAYLVAFGIGSFASISALASTNTTVETFFPRCIPVRLFLHRVQRVRLHLRHHHREAESRVLFFLSRTLLPTSSSPAPPQPQLRRRRHGELRSAHLPRGVPAGVRQSRHAPPHRLRGRARDRAPMVRRRVDGRRLERRVPTTLRNENPWKNRETDLGVFLEKSFPR